MGLTHTIRSTSELSNSADIQHLFDRLTRLRERLYNLIMHANYDLLSMLLDDNEDVLDLLLEYPVNSNLYPIHLASTLENRNIIKLLLDKHNNVNAASFEKGWTPLHLACKFAGINTVKLLLSYGADLNAQDTQRWTPLHVACQFGKKDVIQCLLDNGANLSLNKPNKNNMTPDTLYFSQFSMPDPFIKNYLNFQRSITHSLNKQTKQSEGLLFELAANAPDSLMTMLQWVKEGTIKTNMNEPEQAKFLDLNPINQLQ